MKVMSEEFYNALAPYYKYIYPDWDSSVTRQATILDEIVREYVGTKAQTILDVACGIGTQSIGLAKISYQVDAADISSGEIAQAKIEAARHGVEIAFQIADMRHAWEVYQKEFDVVIACDNAIPHLLTDKEILHAFKQLYQCTKTKGACIITVRDYAKLEREKHHKEMYPRLVHSMGDKQIVMFDVWDFYDHDHYEITTYVIQDAGDSDVNVKAIRGGRYYCIEIPVLARLLKEAGFQDVRVLQEPYFQPLLIAIK